MSNNSKIGLYELIIKDLIQSHTVPPNDNLKDSFILGGPIGNSVFNPECGYTEYQKNKINEIDSQIKNINQKLLSSNYYNKIMQIYINWINKVKQTLIEKINENNLYYFFNLDPNSYLLYNMKDYYDVPDTDKLFSFSLFIYNVENLTYFIGLVYNFAIIKKHFPEYKMRIYIDFHSVFGSPETFNVFNMFIDILKDIDPRFSEQIQLIVFFINPYYVVDNESIYESMVSDIFEVVQYYNSILYNTNANYIKSPLLNSATPKKNKSETEHLPQQEIDKKNFIEVDTENLEITYTNINSTAEKTTFVILSCHISVNLRFLPMNENCEFHVRDLDSRLSLTDKNIINKFNNPKYQYVPYYVFQFYKFYFPYLKWRIDVNPYLAGCFGGNNKKNVMISKELKESGNMKILKKELFFKYILFISFNSTNLQIGFLNDEFILANIFEKIKGEYSENVLFLNLGSFANKHVNEYYYALNNSENYPCILKLGVPIDILRYPLNGKYLSIDPITDFKIGNIPLKYQIYFKELITEQLKIYLGYNNKETTELSNRIRINYKNRLSDEINDDLEAALFFSMIPSTYSITGINEFNKAEYTQHSYTNQNFSSIGEAENIIKNEKLKATNFMMAGYLLADILEDIIFPTNPQYINSNYYVSNDNYDRLFNCLYYDDIKNKFIQRKINKKDISKKYINKEFVEKIPDKYLEFDNKTEIIQTLSYEFNEYLKTCTYYPSMAWFLSHLSFNKFIQLGNSFIKSGLLLFIKNYESPIYDNNESIINNLSKYDVKTLKYDLNKVNNNINGISINKTKLRFNLILLDDTNINQLVYHNTKNKSTVNIKLIKSDHIDKLIKLVKKNDNDYLIVDNI